MLRHIRLAACLLLCLPAISFPAQEEAKAHFAYVGPLAQFLPAGKSAGLVTSGLPFSIVLTDGGKSIGSGPYELKIPGVDKPLKLTLNGLKFEGGRVTAQAKVENGTGAAVEGVRLDITGATETYKAKDDQGKEVLKTRPQKVAMASPLFFGDIADGADNGALGLEAGAIAFAPETVQVAVSGLVSGLRYLSSIRFGEASTGGQIDVDSQGRIYLADTVGNRVARIDKDGKNLVTAAKLPDQCKGMAVNRKTGDIAANCANFPKIFIFTADGDAKAGIGEAQGLDGYPDHQRYDPNGNLWSNVGGPIWKFGPDGKPVLKIAKAGDYDVSGSSGFDVGADGTVYVLTDKTLFGITPDGRSAKRIATSLGAKLGQLVNPSSCRVDAQGNIYVTETEAGDAEASRVSVFDRAGNLVRVFGRGAKTPAPNFPDEYHQAQVFNPGDVAFGPDGLVYVSHSIKGEGSHVMVFRPF
jgi:hypothetical protein